MNDSDFVPMAGFNLSVHFTDLQDARRVFAALAEGGAVNTPLSRVDWAELFGMVTDRFGVPWLILALKSR